jgi:aryl-alcohol dehydrogenase-like predicted oxidoreductase
MSHAMADKELGRTGIKVSRIALGCGEGFRHD